LSPETLNNSRFLATEAIMKKIIGWKLPIFEKAALSVRNILQLAYPRQI